MILRLHLKKKKQAKKWEHVVESVTQVKYFLALYQENSALKR